MTTKYDVKYLINGRQRQRIEMAFPQLDTRTDSFYIGRFGSELRTDIFLGNIEGATISMAINSSLDSCFLRIRGLGNPSHAVQVIGELAGIKLDQARMPTQSKH